MTTKETNNEQLILEVAEREFLEKGFNNAKTTEIAKKAGVTHAMLHYYFRTKENLFDVIFHKKSEVIANTLIVSFNNDLPFLDRIKKGIEEHFDFIASNPLLPNFIFNEILNNEERKKRFVDIIKPKAFHVVETLKVEVDKEIKAGRIRNIEPYDLILNIISMNAFIFIASPALKGVLDLNKKQYELFLQRRKAMNVDLILSQLKI